MGNKILELSKKVYEAGFLCDGAWNTFDEHLELDSPKNIKGWFLNEYPEHEYHVPYFSCDWCWKLLPGCCPKDEYYSLNIIFENVGYYEICHGEIGRALIEFPIKDSLHEALLELVCWCIDNGYLKAEGITS